MQQPPLLDTPQEQTSPSHSYSSHFHSTRDHFANDFPVQHHSHSSRLSPPHHISASNEFRYTPASERRLPGGVAHDHSYPRQVTHSPVLLSNGHRKPPPVSPPSDHQDDPPDSPTATGSQSPQKEISNVVIACRQWYLLYFSSRYEQPTLIFPFCQPWSQDSLRLYKACLSELCSSI